MFQVKSLNIFCTKAQQILSQKRVLKRNEFVGYRKEKIVQGVAMRSDRWSYLDDNFHVEVMNYIIIAWLWIATKVPQTPKNLSGSHKEN